MRAPRFFGSTAALTAIVCAAAPVVAQPSPPRRVAVVTVAAASSGAATRMVAAARQLGDARVVVVGDGVAAARRAHARGAVPAERLARLDEVLAAGAEGWRAYLQVAVPFAASRLSKARGDAEPLLPLPGGLEVYADLSLRLGAVLLALGRSDEATEALALCRALDPTREVSLVEFSPDVVEALAKAAAAERPTATLTVRAEPGVRIEIDGRPAGVVAARGPAELTVRLPHGQHVLVARRAGHEPAARAFRIERDTELALALAEDRASAALAAGPDGQSEEVATALAEAVTTFADVDETLWLAVTARRGAPALLAQRCDVRARCTAIVEVGYVEPGLPPALRAAWSTLGRGELRYPPSLPQDRRVAPARSTGERDDRCRVCRSPWLWVGLGATVIASAALIATLVRDDPTPVVIVDPDQF